MRLTLSDTPGFPTQPLTIAPPATGRATKKQQSTATAGTVPPVTFPVDGVAPPDQSRNHPPRPGSMLILPVNVRVAWNRGHSGSFNRPNPMARRSARRPRRLAPGPARQLHREAGAAPRPVAVRGERAAQLDGGARGPVQAEAVAVALGGEAMLEDAG